MKNSDYILSQFRLGRIDTFYKEWYAGFLVYASRYLGSQFAFLAEDCVQDAIYKAYEQRKIFNTESRLKAFIYSCIKNKAIDILRKNHSRENYLSQQDNETGFFNSMIEQETLNLLYNAINSLPDKYKQIFELNFEQGLKNAEIATLLGISESAVKKQKTNMLNLLRAELRRKGEENPMAVFVLLQLLYFWEMKA